jgi:spore coat protein H
MRLNSIAKHAEPGLLKIALSLLASLFVSAAAAHGSSSAELFVTTNIWDAHLTVEPEQWSAIEPRRLPGGPLAGLLRLREAATNREPVFAGTGAKRPGLAGVLGLEMDYIRADLDFAGETYRDVGLRYKGNGTYVTSQFSDKRPFKIDFNRHVKGQRMRGLTRLNLHNSALDASFMHESLSYQLFREAGVAAPRTAYARVWLTVPEERERQYFGLYTLTEEVDRAFLADRFGSRHGMLLKPSSLRGLDYLGDAWEDYERTLNPKTAVTPAEARRLVDFMKLVHKSDDSVFKAEIANYLNRDQFLRFIAVNVLLSNLDSFLGVGQNFYIYLHPETNRFTFIPWDMDLSFGSFGLAGTPRQRVELSIMRPYISQNRLLERVLELEDWRRAYRQFLSELLETVFAPEKLHKQIDELAAVIRPVVPQEGKRAATRFEEAVTSPDGSQPPARFTLSPVHRLRPFIDGRAASVRAQLAGR